MDVTTRTLALPDAEIVHQVRGPLPPADGSPVLLLIGQPMTGDGFAELADLLPERTVVTYDPRGLGASTRSDGRTDNTPQTQAEDLHALIGDLGGPVEIFASSGGAVTGLALVAAHPEDVTTLVAHEPPLIRTLPDAEQAERAEAAVTDAYQQRGWSAGMAAFLAMVSWQGEFTEEFASRPLPDPAQFGMPAGDDGTREDPLLSGTSAAITRHRVDVDALTKASTRVVIAVGEESAQSLPARSARSTAEMLGLSPVMFPSDHGGFHTLVPGSPGRPEAFAARLREVLAGAS
jgi:pimeloyl-ACP methyl ester carboxylesterase